MHELTTIDCSRIAQDLQVRKVQVENVVQLLDEGNTIPFITRYRKERTGGLNEEVIRQIHRRINLLRQLGERKQTILKSIESQGKLQDDLRQAILAADTMKRVEDLYLPYKPKKRTLATTARERGLEGLALAIWHNDPAVARLEEMLPTLVNPEKELPTVAEVQSGVQHILAEMIAETADVRAAVRGVMWEAGKICAVKSDKLPEGQGLEYKDYFQFNESLRQIPPHRILALNRGEKENVIKNHLEWDKDKATRNALRALAEHLLKRSGAGGQGPEKTKADLKSGDQGEVVKPLEMTDQGQEMAVQPGTEAVSESEVSGTAAPLPQPPLTPLGAETIVEAGLAPSLAPVALAQAVPEGEPLVPGSAYRTPHAAFLKTILGDALVRLLQPSLEREIRNELTDEAEGHAVAVFARNLRSLLLQPPLRNRRVLAIDPGFRTGCKVAALDEFGNLLEHAVIYPHAPAPKKGKEKGGKEQTLQAGAETAPVVETATAGPAVVEAAPTAPAVVEAAPTAPAEIEVGPVTPPAVETATPPVEGSLPPQAPVVAETAEAILPATLPPAEPPAIPAAEASPLSTPPPVETPAIPATEAKPLAVAKREESANKLFEIITRHNLNTIVIGNGTACRETEEFISDLINSRLPELSYVIVNEAGASVYSVSQVGREEFPSFDATLRGTISIGRRLQDPLSELVKVDPQNIGVGLYQHDVKRKELKESLEGVVESCVNQVGVDLNTASVPLLRHVSGFNQLVAREVVEYRKQHGPFSCREQLLQVPNLGPARYQQATGFLKVPNSTNPLDTTWIHPESYTVVENLLAELGYSPAALNDKVLQGELRAKLKTVSVEDLAKKWNVGVPTLHDIIEALQRPGRDPREDLPPPVFKKGILKLEDLQPGMELKGTVLNVVDFGAFVDIGLKESGLVHISQMANRYIKNPYDVVAVNDVVTIWVLAVDKERHRVSLTMIKPGTERKPGEKRPAPARGEGPPRGRRPAGPPPQAGQEKGPPPRRHGRGRGRGAPPGRRPAEAPASAAPPATQGEAAAAAARGEAPAPREERPVTTKPAGKPPAPPPRKHRRPPVKLSQDALEGKVPLRTFGELSALFAAKRQPPEPAAVQPAPAPSPEPAATPPPPEQPPANEFHS